ncbi:MAG: hypothetical protein JOY51_02810, partial [Nevskia sp.]|nr:hypothetical protein [Nevskia sp.]
ELLDRFEQLDDYHARRDLIQLATDLFEVHSAIESLSRRDSRELLRECEAVHELMEQVEISDPKSQMHFARGLELSRAFDAFIANEESVVDDADFVSLHHLAPHNAALLRERSRLMDYAERLLRLH